MEVLLEDNPVVSRIWKEWIEKDIELSLMSVEERLDSFREYQWLFPKKKPGKIVELESIYSSVHQRSNRDEFKRWFYVVVGYMTSRPHLGDSSYHQFKKIFKKMFRRERCTSDDFPAQILLVLAMLGYIKKLDLPYSYKDGGHNNHGNHYLMDREKLLDWGCADYTSTLSDIGMPEWEMTHTSTVSFDEDGDDPDRISWTQHPDWLAERQYESIRSVQVVKEGLEQSSRWMFNYNEYQYYYNLSEGEQDNIKKTWISFQKLRDLSCGVIGGCLDDSVRNDGRKGYAGRFYSPMTNMKSEHRHKYLRLDGELITEVDVSNAQPTLLGILMFRETGVMSEWLRQCLDGHFYEWIAEKTNTYSNPQHTLTEEERKTIKRMVMRYLYSCYQPDLEKDYQGEHIPTKGNWKNDGQYLSFQKRLNGFLKKDEPAIFKKIDWYKRNPEYREDKPLFRHYEDESGGKRKKKVGQGKWCSMLSYYLVCQEVEYIKRCIHSLPEDMKFWTIHDCICVKESDSLRVKEVMEQVSRELFGEDITLGLKRENTSEDTHKYSISS